MKFSYLLLFWQGIQMQINLIEVNNLCDEFVLNGAIVRLLSNMETLELAIAISLFFLKVSIFRTLCASVFIVCRAYAVLLVDLKGEYFDKKYIFANKVGKFHKNEETLMRNFI